METASRHLLSKFDSARKLFECALCAGIDRARLGALAGELGGVEVRFALSTGHLYILSMSGESERLGAHAEYARLLAAENFSGDVDSLMARAEAALREAGVPLRENLDAGPRGRGRGRGRGRAPARPTGARPPAGVCAGLQRILDTYPRGDGGRHGEGFGPADGLAQRVDFERCPSCGGDMAVDAGRSELRCGECGAVRELDGTVFDDSQFYSQEGQKAKSGTFNPNRHFQFWWAHLLALEPEEELGVKDDPENTYGEKLLGSLRAIVLRDRKVLRLLTVYDVRAMLREVGRTDLNKNVPLILKKLTGVGPPLVPDSIAVRAENLFTKAIEAGERVPRSGRVNRNYYPYYIFKILEQLVPEQDAETRRVLYYIYVQSRETVEADDADWEQMCHELPELEYRPTDRFLGSKYGPV